MLPPLPWRIPFSTHQATPSTAQSPVLPPSENLLRVLVELFTSIPSTLAYRHSITASCSRVITSLGAKMSAEMPVTTPFFAAQETPSAYHSSFSTSAKLTSFTAVPLDSLHSIVAREPRVMGVVISYRFSPTPCTRPSPATVWMALSAQWFSGTSSNRFSGAGITAGSSTFATCSPWGSVTVMVTSFSAVTAFSTFLPSGSVVVVVTEPSFLVSTFFSVPSGHLVVSVTAPVLLLVTVVVVLPSSFFVVVVVVLSTFPPWSLPPEEFRVHLA